MIASPEQKWIRLSSAISLALYGNTFPCEDNVGNYIAEPGSLLSGVTSHNEEDKVYRSLERTLNQSAAAGALSFRGIKRYLRSLEAGQAPEPDEDLFQIIPDFFFGQDRMRGFDGYGSEIQFAAISSTDPSDLEYYDLYPQSPRREFYKFSHVEVEERGFLKVLVRLCPRLHLAQRFVVVGRQKTVASTQENELGEFRYADFLSSSDWPSWNDSWENWVAAAEMIADHVCSRDSGWVTRRPRAAKAMARRDKSLVVQFLKNIHSGDIFSAAEGARRFAKTSSIRLRNVSDATAEDWLRRDLFGVVLKIIEEIQMLRG